MQGSQILGATPLAGTTGTKIFESKYGIDSSGDETRWRFGRFGLFGALALGLFVAPALFGNSQASALGADGCSTPLITAEFVDGLLDGVATQGKQAALGIDVPEIVLDRAVHANLDVESATPDHIVGASFGITAEATKLGVLSGEIEIEQAGWTFDPRRNGGAPATVNASMAA